MAEEQELGARFLSLGHGLDQTFADAIEVAVEEEDGPGGVADQEPGPELRVVVTVASDALDAGQLHPSHAGRGPDVADTVSHVRDEVDLSSESPQDRKEEGDVVVRVGDGEDLHSSIIACGTCGREHAILWN